MNAADRMDRINLRRNRTMPLLYEVLRIVRPYLDENIERHAERDLHDALAQLFFANGVEVLTDALRDELGLPPRGPDGWTVDEIIALERLRLEIMTRPIAHTIPSGESVDLVAPLLRTKSK